ncbi:hypothetical protein [Marinomonas ushuaiensis]|uniref:hypothetical protein n=1 Tax=Marinomonas ushuaiensis TaxID=263818 RepID=UPI0012ECA0E6|nr:hypothetical protein [Marinomonas ushuaiensis]
MIIKISESQYELDITPQTSNFSLLLLPDTTNNQILATPRTPVSQEDVVFNKATNTLPSVDDFLKESQLIIESDISSSDTFLSHTPNNDLTNTSDEYLDNTKPNLLDLSNIKIQPDENKDILEGVFSKELRDKIAASQTAQQEYLKGQIKEIEYPITEGADGTRYVNIRGVCWRIPNPGSEEPWAVVVSGCNGQKKSFNFELNISPSMILGEDSPFSPDQ